LLLGHRFGCGSFKELLFGKRGFTKLGVSKTFGGELIVLGCIKSKGLSELSWFNL
jgi:hypothetical protein